MIKEGLVENRKDLKRNKILSTIRYSNQISRHDVKKITTYSMTTVLNTINELIYNDFLLEEKSDTSKVGRKPTWLHINPKAQYFIGIEFDANKLNCVVVDFDFKVTYSEEDNITKDMSVDGIIHKIKENIRMALGFLGDSSDKVLGIGVGLPGYINREEGIGLEYAHIKNWKNIKIKEILEEEFKCGVCIENNINTMALAYRWHEYDEISDNFVLLSMKYGTRLSIIMDNDLFTGSGGNAGEIGHMKLINSNRICSCGKVGCVDTEVSLIAIRSKITERMEHGEFKDIKELTGGHEEEITMDMFIKSVLRGSEASKELLEEIIEFLGQCLIPVIATLNPKSIIIASRSGFTGEAFSGRIYDEIKENVTPIVMEGLNVRCIEIEKNMGAYGAAMLVMQKEYMTVESNYLQ